MNGHVQSTHPRVEAVFTTEQVYRVAYAKWSKGGNDEALERALDRSRKAFIGAVLDLANMTHESEGV